MTRPAALDRLIVAWRRPVDAATRRALVAAVFAALLTVALVARFGTLAARAGAVALAVVVCALAIGIVRRARKTWLGVASAIRRALVPADRSLGERALRAVGLVERTAADPSAGSAELAALHLERLIARASADAVENAARRHASRLRAVFGVLLIGACVVVVIAPMRILEGFDVLVARGGRAPVEMTWLSDVRVTVQPPAYLHASERPVYFGSSLSEPAGSVLTVRGTPSRAGRRLVLSDGRREVPFVSDGADGVVARYTLIDDATVRIAARFGGVLIEQSDPFAFRAEPDQAPRVELEGAPARHRLEELQRLDLRYSVSDDYGLREVDLVLRSGGREDRRVLGRLDGQSTSDRGGTVVYPSDKFLRKTFLPVVITVEARDNDGLSGPKWGKSEAIIVDPPVLGAPEAARLAALERARDALTDLVALTMSDASQPADVRERTRHAEDDAAHAATQAMRTASSGVYSGLRVPAGLASFLSGQVQRLEQKPARAALAPRAEDVVLAVDVALRMLAQRDAQSVAKRLGDVAEEAADAARQARESDGRERGSARLDVAIGALDAGGAALQRLGQLGADLGSVTLSELRRIRRSRDAKELAHAEIAARHLAARLRRPNPSFSASQRGGVESGLSGSGAGSGEASNADQRFDELSRQLQQLAQEHAMGVTEVTDALEEAQRAQDLDALKGEASRRAQSVRDAISGLPESGRRQGAAEASAALAREHASAMAENLEAVQLDRAVQSGKDALEALSEAERKAEQDPLGIDALDRAEVSRARGEIQSQLAWAQKQLDDTQRQAEARAKSDLEKSGGREGDLAERARALREAGSQGEGALPQQTTDALERAEELMQDASRELRAGRGQQGNSLQLEAQRWLEQSLPGSTQDPDEGPGDRSDGKGSQDGANGRGMARDAPVPKDKGSRTAEDFRQRVLHGLSQAHGDRLSPAIKRYAERLLQ